MTTLILSLVEVCFLQTPVDIHSQGVHVGSYNVIRINIDTTLTFVVRGRKVSITVPKNLLTFYDGFRKFSDEHFTNRPSVSNLELADVTGDGILDSCLTSITLLSGQSFVKHLVHSNGRTIWSDTMTIVDDFVSPQFWQDESSFNELRPLSNLYSATKLFGGFVSDTLRWSDVERSEFLYYRPSERSLWEQYFRAFKGRAIRYIGFPGYGEMFWYAPKKQFVRLWGP